MPSHRRRVKELTGIFRAAAETRRLELHVGQVQDGVATMTLDLSREDLDRLLAALESYVYWQLSDRRLRQTCGSTGL